MVIHQIINSVFTSNTFILSYEGKAIIIDLGDWVPVKEYLLENHLTPVAVLITHVHYDHIYGIPEFMREYPNIPIYTSELGKESFKNPKWNFSRYHDDPISIESDQIQILYDGDKIPYFSDSNLENSVKYTPGHDHSCLTYQIGDVLFTGDSYIPEIKVIDTFPKSDKALAKKWYAKLMEMSKYFDIYPGHGEIKLKV